MSETLTLADFQPGMFVTYVPYHADGDINHPDCEKGIVSSVSSHYVFVRFGRSETGQACNPDQLVKG